MRRHRPAIAATALGAVAVALAISAMPYAYTGDPSSLESRDGVVVVRAWDHLAFEPETGSRATGLIFYGSSKAPPESYAYLGRACAMSGYSVYIPRFPLNLPSL
ncbi:MAG: alpha/beta hydrolase, partial [Spirochaetaceae bacterium]|nr:alpha/beta hydrolase [Spirochaetaceae bacterium]